MADDAVLWIWFFVVTLATHQAVRRVVKWLDRRFS